MPNFVAASNSAAGIVNSWRDKFGQRFTGLILALLVEALLILIVISMGLVDQSKARKDPSLVSVALRNGEEQERKPEARPKQSARPVQRVQPRQPQPLQPQIVKPPAAVVTPQLIPLSKTQMSTSDISSPPRAPSGTTTPSRGLMGPANTGVAGDSKRVGSAPNGQALYGATWYHEPSDDELRGYLSTANPGWAMIACRTVADFRVEDCVAVDEFPDGSQLLRAVLAAAWQFRVRPPRVGGVSQVGAWVRIRIDYIQHRN